MKINYLVNSSGVINRSHASGYPSSGSNDFCNFNHKFTKIAQVNDQYANIVEANFILKDKQAQSDFYGFQQQSRSEGSPNPLHELSCQRLGLDLDCPPRDSDGRSYQFPSILTVKAAKLESVESGMVRLHRWRVQAVVWLIHMERSHLSAGLLADDMGLDETTSATCYILLTQWYDFEHTTPIQDDEYPSPKDDNPTDTEMSENASGQPSSPSFECGSCLSLLLSFSLDAFGCLNLKPPC